MANVEQGEAVKVTRDVDTQAAGDSASASEKMSREAQDSDRSPRSAMDKASEFQSTCQAEMNGNSISAYMERLTDKSLAWVVGEAGVPFDYPRNLARLRNERQGDCIERKDREKYGSRK